MTLVNDKMVYKDPAYEPHVPKDLLDTSFWCHIRPFVLTSGRVTTPQATTTTEINDGESAVEEVSWFFFIFLIHNKLGLSNVVGRGLRAI